MLNAMDKLRTLWAWMQNYVSPVFISLFCASFILWYIVMLEHNYRVEYEVTVNVDGERLRVPCFVEGKGATLMGYRASVHKQVKIPLDDLRYAVAQKIDEQTGEAEDIYCIIDPQSLLSAIAVRLNDINFISIGNIPPLPMPERKGEKPGKADETKQPAKSSR